MQVALRDRADGRCALSAHLVMSQGMLDHHPGLHCIMAHLGLDQFDPGLPQGSPVDGVAYGGRPAFAGMTVAKLFDGDRGMAKGVDDQEIDALAVDRHSGEPSSPFLTF